MFSRSRVYSAVSRPVVATHCLWGQWKFSKQNKIHTIPDSNWCSRRKTAKLHRGPNEGGFNRISKTPIAKSSIAFSDSECPVIWSVWVQATYFVVMALLASSPKTQRPTQPRVELAALPSLLIDRAASPLVSGHSCSALMANLTGRSCPPLGV